MSQLDENESNDESKRTEHFKFLQDTIKSANDMQELDYFYELKLQQKLGKELSESQMQRYLEIANKLQKYISYL